jgi:hypothetical protein
MKNKNLSILNYYNNNKTQLKFNLEKTLNSDFNKAHINKNNKIIGGYKSNNKIYSAVNNI